MTSAYEELIGVLYDEENRKALEWAIGCALNDGPKKTVVIYGHAATGKTTVTNIVEGLFPGESVRVDVGGTAAVDIYGHTFMEVNSPVDIEDVKTADDVILVQTTGHTHDRLLYYRLMAAIEEETDVISHICTLRYNAMGPGFYDLTVPDAIPEG